MTDFQHVLQFFDLRLQPARISAESGGHGFSGAQIWRLESPAGVFALRAVNEQAVNRDRLSGLHALLAHVHRCGVSQVAVPLATRCGLTVVLYDGQIWQLEPWMPGSPEQQVPSPVRLRAAMHCLAAWHLAAASFEASSEYRHWYFCEARCPSPGIGERIAQIDRWNAAACRQIDRRLPVLGWPEFCNLGQRLLPLYQRLAPAIAAELRIARNLHVPLQPCLRDIWSDHLLFTGDRVSGLIDPHACRSDNVATDLARLLGSLVADDATIRATAIDAYQQIRPLSSDELLLLEIFDRSGVLLGGMTWLDWVCMQGRQYQRRDRVTLRLAAILRRLESLCNRL